MRSAGGQDQMEIACVIVCRNVGALTTEKSCVEVTRMDELMVLVGVNGSPRRPYMAQCNLFTPP